MTLDNEQRRQLRTTMLPAFTFPTLDLFLQDHLNVVLPNVVPAQSEFELQCQSLLMWADQNGRTVEFLTAIVTFHGNQVLKQLAQQLLNTPASRRTPGAVVMPRPFVVGVQPVINRNTFWDRLKVFAGGQQGAGRVLMVDGGVGKSYSRWPVSHMCDPSRRVARMVPIEVNVGSDVNLDGARLAKLIADRLWGVGSLGIDDLSQPNRISRDYYTLIIQKLSTLTERIWLVLDELDLVNLDETAYEFLRRLCRDLEQLQAPNVWLILIGLGPARLGKAARYLPVDSVHRPLRSDIQEYISWFARSVGKNLTQLTLDNTVASLDNLLPQTPNHQSWDEFHEQLRVTCDGIVQGTVV
jgi:hypothetical protein